MIYTIGLTYYAMGCIVGYVHTWTFFRRLELLYPRCDKKARLRGNEWFMGVFFFALVWPFMLVVCEFADYPIGNRLQS